MNIHRKEQESHGQNVWCNAFCGYVCVCSWVCEVCLCLCPGCTLTHLCRMSDGDSLFTFPSSNMPMIAVWAERPAGSILKTLCLFRMEQLRPAKRSSFPASSSSQLWSAPSQQCTLLPLIALVYQGCVCTHVLTVHVCVSRLCASFRWSKSCYWSPKEPPRIQIRYSWKMNYITKYPRSPKSQMAQSGWRGQDYF